MSKKLDTLKGGLNSLINGDEATRHATWTEAQEEATEAVQTPTEADAELLRLLHAKRSEKRGRPAKGLKDYDGKPKAGYSRVTTNLNDEQVAKIHYIALHETKTLKQLWEEALNAVISRYEKAHGKIPVEAYENENPN